MKEHPHRKDTKDNWLRRLIVNLIKEALKDMIPTYIDIPSHTLREMLHQGREIERKHFEEASKTPLCPQHDIPLFRERMDDVEVWLCPYWQQHHTATAPQPQRDIHTAPLTIPKRPRPAGTVLKDYLQVHKPQPGIWTQQHRATH